MLASPLELPVEMYEGILSRRFFFDGKAGNDVVELPRLFKKPSELNCRVWMPQGLHTRRILLLV